jgi:hypothetical protein
MSLGADSGVVLLQGPGQNLMCETSITMSDVDIELRHSVWCFIPLAPALAAFGQPPIFYMFLSAAVLQITVRRTRVNRSFAPARYL